MLSAMTIVLAIGGTAAETEPTQTLYAAGTQATFVGPEKLFTGDVFVEMLFPSNATANFSGAYVTFQPGARTAWHLHPGGQHMIVTDGTALTGTRDGTVLAFHEGETVWCPPDIDHWHGATPDAPMTHLVITGVKDSKNVIWKEKVTDEQYYTGKYQKKGDPMTAIESLTPQQQAIIPIAAFTANGDQEPLKIAVQAGLDAGLTVNEIKEVMVQLYAYAGFPRSLNALATCMTVVNERKAQGIEDETGKEASPLPEDKSVLELGTEVQTQLAGRPVAGPLFDFAPVANEYLQAHLFGDIFGRDVLGFQDRELATVAALASMTGVEPQLNAHVGMAANAGVTHQQLVDLVTVLKNKVGEPEGQRAEEAMNK
jgi:quercetin dioxygenase-like cupin family protein